MHTFCRRRSLYAYKRTAALWLLNDSSIEKIVFNTSNNNRPQSRIFELIGISNQDLKNQKTIAVVSTNPLKVQNV